MKGLAFILTATIGCFTCTKAICSSMKQAAGLELTSAFREHAVCMTIGYALSERWSVDINACIGTDIIKRRFSNDELKHYEELRENLSSASEISEEMTPSVRMALRHWITTPYEGGFFAGGAVLRHSGRHDITAGTGYAFKIYKRLGGAVIYEVGLMETYRNSFSSGNEINEIRIEIYCRF